jgi:hypothetical protein
MEHDLEYERQMIFEELDLLNVNNDKDSDEDSDDDFNRILKY